MPGELKEEARGIPRLLGAIPLAAHSHVTNYTPYVPIPPLQGKGWHSGPSKDTYTQV